jgi:short-subunit dehydrogenase
MNEGGSIVMIGSNEAHIGLPALSLYGGAKAAIVAWARGFSLDLLTTTSSISSVLRWKTGGSVKDTSISLPASRIFHIAFLRT